MHSSAGKSEIRIPKSEILAPALFWFSVRKTHFSTPSFDEAFLRARNALFHAEPERRVSLPAKHAYFSSHKDGPLC